MDRKTNNRWVNAAKGIRYREHSERKHGKRFDRYYALQYKRGGKVFNEAVGWASDGVTQDECEKMLVMLRENWRSGTGPQTLAETRAEAQAQREAEALALEKEKERLVTVGEYFLAHYLPQSKRSKKITAWGKEESLFRHWIDPAVGKIPLVELGFKQWDIMLSQMDKAKRSQRTKEYAAGTLRRILRHAQDRGHDVNIPTAKQVGATAPKDNRRLRILTPEESENILKEVLSYDIHAWRLVKFAMLSGCRASEAFQLKWQNVDLDSGTLRFLDTKNKDTRTLFLSPALVELLKSFKPEKASGIVFLRSDGKPHVEAPFHFKKAVEELKLNEGRQTRDRVTFHSIRHTVATNLARILDVRSLMDVMGWKQVAMAARYIHSDEKTTRAAMNSLEDSIIAKPAKKKILNLQPGR
ncbi:tyrosine-type recombinase/integrase [Desulfovibrio sp. OttesenSCG-928-C14]|nr:tyrosine-type recombinase/integrase [Desulfovibrio sp. OttesenSCG-928-C14]